MEKLFLFLLPRLLAAFNIRNDVGSDSLLEDSVFHGKNIAALLKSSRKWKMMENEYLNNSHRVILH
jgi:hypothetical protein